MTSPHVEKPISDLRRRMLQDMSNRNFGDKTKHDYIRQVEALAKFLSCAPDTLTGDELRRFQADQIARGAQPPKMNSQASALRFFFTITLGRPDLANQLARTIPGSYCACSRPKMSPPPGRRRLMLEKLAAAHASGKLNFFRHRAHVAEARGFLPWSLSDAGPWRSPLPSSSGRHLKRITLAVIGYWEPERPV
jgi:hypothetical protein